METSREGHTSIFGADSYIEVIRTSLKDNESIRGFQSRLSEAAGCTTSYFSRVLCGRYHLNLEQAFSLCQFWKLDQKETAYFLLLVVRARAASPGLKAQIEKYLERFAVLDSGIFLPSFNGRGSASIEG